MLVVEIQYEGEVNIQYVTIRCARVLRHSHMRHSEESRVRFASKEQ